jgi:hypothetical protein
MVCIRLVGNEKSAISRGFIMVGLQNLSYQTISETGMNTGKWFNFVPLGDIQRFPNSACNLSGFGP